MGSVIAVVLLSQIPSVAVKVKFANGVVQVVPDAIENIYGVLCWNVSKAEFATTNPERVLTIVPL